MKAAKSSAKKSPEVTPWFPKNVKPVRRGLYQRDYEGGHDTDMGVLIPDHWDGRRWHIADADGRCVAHATPTRRWRGLASDPSKVAK